MSATGMPSPEWDTDAVGLAVGMLSGHLLILMLVFM